MKSVEQQLAEANETIKTLTEKNKQLEESAKAANKTAAAGELNRLTTEAKLPEPIVKLLQKQFAEAVKTDGMKESVDAFAESIKAAGVVKKNNGAADNAATQEGDGAKAKANLVESFVKNFGVTKEQAELMAE